MRVICTAAIWRNSERNRCINRTVGHTEKTYKCRERYVRSPQMRTKESWRVQWAWFIQLRPLIFPVYLPQSFKESQKVFRRAWKAVATTALVIECHRHITVTHINKGRPCLTRLSTHLACCIVGSFQQTSIKKRVYKPWQRVRWTLILLFRKQGWCNANKGSVRFRRTIWY